MNLPLQPLSHLLPFLLPLSLQAQSIALTFDDGAKPGGPRMSAPEVNAAILSHLKAAGVRSTLFFTVGDGSPERLALAKAWGEAGHGVGNHTVSHLSLNATKTTLAAFEAEVKACDAVIRTLPGYTKRFRFTYLKEGNTVEKRDGFRAFLKAFDYQPAPVTVDASDWYYSIRLIQRLEADPQTDLAPWRKAYLAHLWDRAQAYEAISQQVAGRSVKHVLLLHANLANALFLGDAIQMFRERGWTIVPPEAAFADPIYREQPQILPAGESLLWSLAKARGMTDLRYPAEDDVYEKPILDRLGL